MAKNFRGITFKPVTRDNWLKLIKLDVYAEQSEGFAEHAGLYVLAHSAMYPDWKNFAIYHEEDIIGYFNCQFHESPHVSVSNIKFLFIDKKFQSQGLGTASVARITEQIRSIYPMAQEIRFHIGQDNQIAKHILEKQGYTRSGNVSAAGNLMYYYSLIK